MSVPNKKSKRNNAAIGEDQAVGKLHLMPKGLTQIVQPKASAKSRIRPIGNSRGVILSNQVIEAAGLNVEADILIQAVDGVIYILQVKASHVNTNLSTWDKQFKKAIKKGAKPEEDLFENMTNDFDLKEW